MFFNDTAKIKWKGKEYLCAVTMEKIKIAESYGFNAAVTNARCSGFGVPPLSLVAEMVYWLLVFGECEDKKLTEEAVYAELMNNSMGKDNVEIIKAAKTLSELFIPKIEASDRKEKGEKKK